MRVVKSAAALLAACGALLIAGCGDTFRPIEAAIPKPGPDPQNQKYAVVLSSSPNVPGAVQLINVSGDTVSAQLPVGRTPVEMYSDLATTVTANAEGSLSSFFTISGSGASVITSSLPAGASPSFVVISPVNYYVADPVRQVVYAVNRGSGVLAAEIPLGGATPSALVALPNGSKVYSLNKANGTVTVINTADNTLLGSFAVGSSPLMGVASPDSSRVFVVNQGGTITVIDTTNDTGANNATVTLGGAPSFAAYSSTLTRLYVANSGNNTVSAINADPQSAAYLAVTTIPVAATPAQLTVLADGSRVYISNTASNSVTVINATSNTVKGTIAVGTQPLSISSSSDSTKVFVANKGSLNTSIIRTLDDTEVIRIAAAKVDPQCQDASSTNPTCARQTPLQVVVTP